MRDAINHPAIFGRTEATRVALALLCALCACLAAAGNGRDLVRAGGGKDPRVTSTSS